MTNEPADSPELQKYRAEVESSANSLLASLTLLLKARRVHRVHISYQGGGDSGQVEETTCFDNADKVIELDEVTKDRIEAFAYALMDKRGWEWNNEGSSGTIDWHIGNDTMEHEHTYHEYGKCEIDHDHDAEDADCESPLEDGDGYHTFGLDDMLDIAERLDARKGQ